MVGKEDRMLPRQIGLMLCGFSAVTLALAGGWILFGFLTREVSAPTAQGSAINRTVAPSASEPAPSAPAPAAEPGPAPMAKSEPPPTVPATEPAAGEAERTKEATRPRAKKKKRDVRPGGGGDDGDDE
jgi:outer membrane biosynthesis protein TonB